MAVVWNSLCVRLSVYALSVSVLVISLSLCPSLLCSLSCPSPWRCHSVWQGAEEGVAAQGLHRLGLQHRRRGGWRRHLRLLHPGRRTGRPERRAEEGWPDSLGQYLNLELPVCQRLQRVWGRDFQPTPVVRIMMIELRWSNVLKASKHLPRWNVLEQDIKSITTPRELSCALPEKRTLWINKVSNKLHI